MSQHPKRKRRGPDGFQWHADQSTDDHGDEQLRTTRLRYTNVNLGTTGASSFSTSYIIAPASPEKRADLSAHGPHNLEGADDDILPGLIDCLDSDDEEDDMAAAGDAQLDPQYQEHLTALESDDAPRAKRIPAVSHGINILDQMLNIY